jgi:acyl-CoA dehydrogenase
MTATALTSPYRPAPARPGDDLFVPLAAELGAGFAERAAEHDRENTFVEENFAQLRESGYTALAIPEELGGLGASLRRSATPRPSLLGTVARPRWRSTCTSTSR